MPSDAELGMFHLEKAVVTVLQSAHDGGEESLGPAEISRRAGIFRNRGLGLDDQGLFDDLTSGTLAKLIAEGRIERPRRGRYRLSQPPRLPT